MLSKRIFSVLLPCIGLGLAGCSLITNVDRTKIDDGAGGSAGSSTDGGAGGEAGSANGGTTSGGTSSNT